jgi:hypothetical protein
MDFSLDLTLLDALRDIFLEPFDFFLDSTEAFLDFLPKILMDSTEPFLEPNDFFFRIDSYDSFLCPRFLIFFLS